jgi:hypothetical protein
MSVLDTLREAFSRAREKKPGFTEDMSEEALVQILAALGGEQVILPKTTQGRAGRPAVADDVQRAAYDAAMRNEPIERITSSTGISRASLYRLIKRGPATGR